MSCWNDQNCISLPNFDGNEANAPRDVEPAVTFGILQLFECVVYIRWTITLLSGLNTLLFVHKKKATVIVCR